MVFVNPQLDADMTRIGCRVCALDPCLMCQSCERSNGLKCIHTDRWRRIKEAKHEKAVKLHQGIKKHFSKLNEDQKKEYIEGVKRRGGYRGCEAGYRDDGATCFKDLHCDTSCGGDWWNPTTWHCNTSCSGPSMYGKYDDEFLGAFNQIGNFFKNLPSVIMDAFSPNGPLAHVFDPNLNGVADGLRKAGDAIKNSLENAFDPEKNGVAASMRKFGSDLEKGFEEIGKKLTDTFSKENMDRAFGPMVAAFNSFGDSLKDYFSDPSNILGFVTMAMSVMAAALPQPFGAAMSLLASCTQMIGNACLGKPFDPMDLLDMATSMMAPQAKLAKTIATTVAKATTIAGKLAKGASAAVKSTMQTARESVKRVAAMSAKDKALACGKVVFKISGKLGTSVMMQNPVESQQTPEERQHDEEIGDAWAEDANDPQREVNSAEMEAELAKEEYDLAVQQERDAGTITGEYKAPREASKNAKKSDFIRNEVIPSLEEQTQRATTKPRSYIVNEKIFFYRDSTKSKREEELANAARKKAEAELQKQLAEARLTEGKNQKQIADDKKWADRQEFKAENEKRKYGFTYDEALVRLKLYAAEQAKFATATGFAPKVNIHPPHTTVAEREAQKKGGIKLVDSPPPEFMMADVEDRGQGDFGNAPYLPPIITPTFWHFVKEKFAPIPELKDPENWFLEYNKFWDAYDKQKIDYQKLIDANKIAMEARKKMTAQEKDKAYQEWLTSDAKAESPLNIAVNVKNQGKQAFLEFIRNEGFNEQSWNSQMKILDREDLMIDVPPPTPRDKPIKPTIPMSNNIFKVPDGDPQNISEDSERYGGGVDTPLVQPSLCDAMTYFRYKLVNANPYNQPDENEIRAAYEMAWENQPQQTLAAINAYILNPPGSNITGKGKNRRTIRSFFGLRGGSDDWATPDTTDYEAVNVVKSSKHADIKNVLDAEAREEIASELFSSDIPAALQEYLAASIEDKREKRGAIQAFREWGKEEYGVPTESDAWYQSWKSVEDDIEQQAPELNDQGLDEQIPKDAYENTDEGKLDVESHAKASGEQRTAEEAEARQKKELDEFEKKTAADEKKFTDAKKIFDEEYKVAVATENEDFAKAAIDKFNANFPEGDRRRLSGSGNDVRPPPTLILRNLWLGNMNDAQNKTWLKRHKIHKVFNCTHDLPESPGVPTVRFAIHDSREDGDKMLKNGLKWAEKIMEAMEEGPVLVHCREGRQRSATLALVLLGLKHPAQLHILMKKLQAKRPIALTPVPTFTKALKKWFYGSGEPPPPKVRDTQSRVNRPVIVDGQIVHGNGEPPPPKVRDTQSRVNRPVIVDGQIVHD